MPSREAASKDAITPCRVDGRQPFRLDDWATAPPPGAPGKRHLQSALATEGKALDRLQRALYAERRRSLLLIFQAMDAGGKDSTIRAVFNRVDPAGCRVHSFGPPSDEELARDFLWRSTVRLPARGEIGIFNRSYYEEVITVRVRPGLLQAQRLPPVATESARWTQRLRSIREHERHLHHNGVTICKFWLHVSRDEQRDRLLSRLNNPRKRWKFDAADLQARAHWDDYMHAVGDAIGNTARPWAPWYVVPADDKAYLRWVVARITRATLESMNPQYPPADPEWDSQLDTFRQRLRGE